VAHYYACKFGLDRLRIGGDIRQKAAITAILENVVTAIYRLRPIQLAYGLRSLVTQHRQSSPRGTPSKFCWNRGLGAVFCRKSAISLKQGKIRPIGSSYALSIGAKINDLG